MKAWFTHTVSVSFTVLVVVWPAVKLKWLRRAVFETPWIAPPMIVPFQTAVPPLNFQVRTSESAKVELRLSELDVWG